MESSSVFDRLTPQNIDLRGPVTGFSVFAARKMEREPKNERGGRGRGWKETCFLLFFPTPSPLFYSRHFSRGPRSLLQNRTLTLATQAICGVKGPQYFKEVKMLTLRS